MAQFRPGQSGNPNGGPKGSRNKTTLAIEKLLEDDAAAIIKKAIELAKGGDTALIRLCLDRLYAPRSDRPVPFTLPDMTDSVHAIEAAAAITAGGGSGRRADATRGRRPFAGCRQLREGIRYRRL